MQIRNLWAVDGDNYPYQLRVLPLETDVELTIDSDQPYVYTEGAGTWKVKAFRKGGFQGAIRLQVEGLPKGITAQPAEIPQGATEVEITLRASGGEPGAFSSVQVFSGPLGRPAWKSVRVAGAGSAFVKVDKVTLAVVEQPKFSLEAGLNSVTLVPGGSVEIPVHIRRADDFEGEIELRFENLLPGVSFEAPSAAAEAKEVKILVRASQETPVSRSDHVVILGCDKAGHTQAAPEITMMVE